MKQLLIKYILFIAKQQIETSEKSQKKVGMSGSSVSVPHSVVLKLAIEDKYQFKKYLEGK